SAREVYPECGPVTDGAVDPDGPAVAFHDRAAEVEADAQTALPLRRRAADETLKDALLLGGRDAGTAIANGHAHDGRAGRRRGHRDGRAFGRIANGVFQQVEQNLVDTLGIDGDGQRAGGQLDRYGRRVAAAKRVDGFVDDGGEVGGARANGEQPQIGAGEIPQILAQARRAPHLPARGREDA